MTDIFFSDEVDAIGKAEANIRQILFDLEEETGMTVWKVEVDTRRFNRLTTEIGMEIGMTD